MAPWPPMATPMLWPRPRKFSAYATESTKLITLRLAIKMMRLYSDHQVLCDRGDANHKH